MIEGAGSKSGERHDVGNSVRGRGGHGGGTVGSGGSVEDLGRGHGTVGGPSKSLAGGEGKRRK